MLYRLLFGRGNRFLCLFTGLRRASSTEAEAVDVYVAANRTRFYRTLGIFTLVQGVAWSAFGTYLFSKRNEKLTWQMMRRDIYEFNRLIADRLESWTPETVKKLILRSRKTLVLDEPAISVADEAQPEPMECVLNSAVVETEEPELKRFADKVKEAFGVLRPDRAALEKEDIKSRRLIPYICFAMGAFTFFVGGLIPRRVIRRISLLPMKPSENTAILHPENYDPTIQVNTYGWFGTFPRRGNLITIPMSSIRATVGFREDSKFMNLIIGRRPFTFYLERSEAEFLLPEYFEHLNSNAISSKK